jgi:NTE family protein
MTGKSPGPQSKGKTDKQIALALQGGGALGSYQAGVYEALAEYDYQPDWVAGISIGAINCAIIAGNAPRRRRKSTSGLCTPRSANWSWRTIF